MSIRSLFRDRSNKPSKHQKRLAKAIAQYQKHGYFTTIVGGELSTKKRSIRTKHYHDPRHPEVGESYN